MPPESISPMSNMVEPGPASDRDWLAVLNTVRTEHFDEVLAMREIVPAFAMAIHVHRGAYANAR